MNKAKALLNRIWEYFHPFLNSMIFTAITYSILFFIKIPTFYNLAASTVIFLIIYGLSKYYSTANSQPKLLVPNSHIGFLRLPEGIFIVLYAISIGFTYTSTTNIDIYSDWHTLSLDQIVRLSFAIFISTFAPGYAVLSLLVRDRITILPRILGSYLISLLITGMIGYSVSMKDETHLLTQYVAWVNSVLIVCVTSQRILLWLRMDGIKYDFGVLSLISKNTVYKVLLFSALLTQVILSTYILLNGTIIGDNWYYHGRALYIMSGDFREVAESGLENELYPPFSMAFLGTYFSISDIPSVNAYAALGFVNFLPVISFYYFFSSWVPRKYARAGPFAVVFFTLGSGLGWIYALNLSAYFPPLDEEASLENLFNAGQKTIDIYAVNTFIGVAHPDVTTALNTISLPAGFFLLGLIKDHRFRCKVAYSIVIGAVSALGLLAHDEFGFFIIVAIVSTTVFMLSNKNPVYLGIGCSITCIIFLSYLLPGQEQYYLERGIFGIPFLFLYLLFTIGMWVIYYSNNLHRFFHYMVIVLNTKYVKKLRNHTHYGKVFISITICCLVAYIYGLSFVIWYDQLPGFQVYVDTLGLRDIPEYMFPLRLGINGLLGISLLLLFLFRKLESSILVFGLFALGAYVILSQYSDFRASRYIMTAFDALAAILMYKIITILLEKMKRRSKAIMINNSLIGLVVLTSSFSAILYMGINAIGLQQPENVLFNSALSMRDFPDADDFELVRFINNNTGIDRNDGIAYNTDERWSGIIPLLSSFTKIPASKILQSSLTSDESTLEGMLTLLKHTNAKYIVIEKNNIGNLSSPMIFAMNNFERAFENNKYTVLSTPNILPPSSISETALLRLGLDSQHKDLIKIDTTLIPPDDDANSVTSNEESSRLYQNKSFILEPQADHDFYYAISTLGSSGLLYDTFDANDFSWISKKHIVLPSDINNSKIYQEYVSRGGNLTVFSNDLSAGSIARLLCIKPLNLTKFDQIFQDKQRYNISGTALNFEVTCKDVKIASHYFLGDKAVAPFLIQKHFGKGYINFVNSEGLIKEVLAPRPHFGHISIPGEPFQKAEIKQNYNTKNENMNGDPIPYFSGILNLSGKVEILSPSVMFEGNMMSSDKIQIFEGDESYNLSSLNSPLSIELGGRYLVKLNSKNIVYEPHKWTYGYFGFTLLPGSNITITLTNSSSANLTAAEGKSFEIRNSGSIVMTVTSPINLVTKYPKVSVNGNVLFNDVRSHNPKIPNTAWVDRDALKMNGNVTFQFNHINPINTGSKEAFMTYFNWNDIKSDSEEVVDLLSLRREQKTIEFDRIILSYFGTRILIPAIIIGLVSLYMVYSSPRLRSWFSYR